MAADSRDVVARCAACLQPFAATERKVVADTEVFHDRCTHLVARSLTNKLKTRVIDLSAQIKLAEIAGREVAQLRASIDIANADARRIQSENDRLSREVRDARTQTRVRESAVEHQTNRIVALENEVRAKTDRISALEREVALHQTIQGTRTQQPTTVTDETKADPATKNEDKRDDTEKRFSLLELD